MSMIDCKVNVAKKEDPKGDRVVLTFECDLCPFPFSVDTYVLLYSAGNFCLTPSGEEEAVCKSTMYDYMQLKTTATNDDIPLR
jgi:hypothetical protein